MYYPCLDADTKNRLQKIQNTCCRFVCGLRKFDHVSSKFHELRWLKLDATWKLHFGVFVANYLHSSLFKRKINISESNS